MIHALAAAALVALGACTARDDAHETANALPGAQGSPIQPGVVVADSKITAPPDTVRRAAAPAGAVTPAPVAVPAARSIRDSSPHAAPPAPAPARGPRRVMLGDLDLTGVGYDRGSVTAPVVVIDFSDFGCPYCASFTRETYPVLEREYVKTGKVFFKYVPFVVGMFPHSAEATRAVECAADQGRFWPMADHVYEAQSVWKHGGDPRPLLMGIADVVGADSSAVGRCYADRHTDARTERASGIARRMGVRVTPSFVVNERPIEGALPLADFRTVIDAALLVAKAGGKP